MIHFAIGTKAQFIKMAPIMHMLERTRERYHLLDLSQHGNITGRILDDFGLRPTITSLGDAGRSVETYWQAVRWLARGFYQVWFRRRGLRRRWFVDTDGVVLVHGDTLSTLLGLYFARAAGLRIGLVEAGLTSHHLLDPFPEEWIRRHVERRADYLFAPGRVAESQLWGRRLRGFVINTRYNTGYDALRLVLDRSRQSSIPAVFPKQDYGVATLHRLETLTNKSRLQKAIRHILALSEKLGELYFYVHPPTANALKSAGLLDLLSRSPNIRLRDLAPYPEFVAILCKARYVFTDGGSIQEEAAYLNKPCLILRNRTEREEGLGGYVCLSTWDARRDIEHLQKAEMLPTPASPFSEMEASRIIVDALSEFRTEPTPR